MFSFRNWFAKPKWTEVKLFKVSGTEIGTKRSVVIYIHLFESSVGSRRYEAIADSSDFTASSVIEFVKTTELYNTQIHRWLHGRYDPEIPRYDQISEEDVIAALKGTI